MKGDDNFQNFIELKRSNKSASDIRSYFSSFFSLFFCYGGYLSFVEKFGAETAKDSMGLINLVGLD